MMLKRSVLVAVIAFAVVLSAVVTAQGAPAPQAPAVAKVDINSASQADLEKLPGVGAATAKKIIAGRPYTAVADLAKAGVPNKTIEKITPLVSVGAAVPAAATKAVTPPAQKPVAPAAAAAAPAAAAAAATTAPTATAQVPPVKGMVWVNTETKVYHFEGDKWYGKTKHGKFMTEDEAIKAGYHASKEGGAKKK